MGFFANFEEFVEYDSRAGRGFSPITPETLDNRHEVTLPKWVVEGSTVLDLGSCIGATGHWSLSHGCTHYTGVEVQPKLVETSRELLAKHWSSDKFEVVQSDVREFLKKEVEAGKKYDVIVMIGIVYAFLDPYTFLEQVTKLCNYAIVIDSLYPWNMVSPNVPMNDVIRVQHINSSDEGNVAFLGAGCRISPEATRIMMDTLGFEDREGVLMPKPLSDKSLHDTYNTPIERPGSKSYRLPARWLMRFYNTGVSNIKPVGDYVRDNVSRSKTDMAKAPVMAAASSWSFDESVAQRFQTEAETHIPDYARVIDLCIDLTKQVYDTNLDVSIIDVGSALGNTMDKFIEQGYSNVFGVDNSEAMIKSSKYPDLTILSNNFPVDKEYDVVLANWTLHFINEREEYLRDIYNSMSTGGLLVLSDKMEHSQEIENLYYDFKRANGVSEEVIQKKKLALVGILTTRPLQWYLDTLKTIGFSGIQVVNSKFMFSTIYARKL